MCAATISFDFKSDLYFYNENESVNSETYIKWLKNQVKPFIKNNYKNKNYIF